MAENLTRIGGEAQAAARIAAGAALRAEPAQVHRVAGTAPSVCPVSSRAWCRYLPEERSQCSRYPRTLPTSYRTMSVTTPATEVRSAAPSGTAARIGDSWGVRPRRPRWVMTVQGVHEVP